MCDRGPSRGAPKGWPANATPENTNGNDDDPSFLLTMLLHAMWNNIARIVKGRAHVPKNRDKMAAFILNLLLVPLGSSRLSQDPAIRSLQEDLLRLFQATKRGRSSKDESQRWARIFESTRKRLRQSHEDESEDEDIQAFLDGRTDQPFTKDPDADDAGGGTSCSKATLEIVGQSRG